ncbi:MAG TPA: RHS repeat-associated core domain-containing protein, partial [Polyangiaceae bacterium]|nr:RHS repeat-associated core domain-containing protein [Polyangiaceae bacterium]
VGGDYERTDMTEVPYLLANGVRLARVVYDPNIPVSGAPAQHVFFELGDHLGSTSTVMDQATGELVEKGTYQPYGNADSDYRPDRWKFFREDYRFTGKEEDVEVGLTYFGKRFYNAQLGRWMSPDPLAIHDAGKADLNVYAYVKGRALSALDPVGLADTSQDAAYDYLRKKATPSDGASVAAPAEAYGLNSGSSGPMEVDHIVSVKSLATRVDFASLTLEQQIDIARTPENLAMLNASRNASKGEMSASEYAQKLGLTGDARASVDALQGRAQVALDNKIKAALDYNRINGVNVAEADAAYLRSHGRRGMSANGFESELVDRVFDGVTRGVWRNEGETLGEAIRRGGGAEFDPRPRVVTRTGRMLRSLDFGATLWSSYMMCLDKNEYELLHEQTPSDGVLVYRGSAYIKGAPGGI